MRVQRGRFLGKKQKQEVGGSAGTHLDAAFIPTVALLRVQADEAHLREERRDGVTLNSSADQQPFNNQ